MGKMSRCQEDVVNLQCAMTICTDHSGIITLPRTLKEEDNLDAFKMDLKNSLKIPNY